MKKIAIINTYNRFSTGTIAKSIGDYLNNFDFEYKLFYGRLKDKTDEKSVFCGTNKFINFINNVLVKITGRIGFYHRFETRKLIRKIKEYNPDIINIHNIHGNYVNYKMLFKYLSGKKIIITMHDCFWLTGRCAHFVSCEGECDGWKYGCSKCKHKDFYMSTLLFDNANKLFKIKRAFINGNDVKLVCLSNWQKKYFLDSGINKESIFLIHNGIEIFNQTEREKGNKIRLIGVASFWNKSKGLEEFNYLASKLDSSKYEITLLGNIPSNFALNSNIISLGLVSNSEVGKYLNESDLFINPTYVDTFPTVLIECLAAKLPCVSYNSGGCSEIIGDCGVTVEKGKKEDMLEAIQSINLSSYKIESFQEQFDKFSKKRMLQKYLELFLMEEKND